jgi:hypothetical protein
MTACILGFEIKMRNNFSDFGTRLQGLEYDENPVKYIGTALRIFDEHVADIHEAVSKATSIRNTLIFHYAANPGNIEPSLVAHLRKAARNRNSLIASVVDHGGEWEEIFCRNTS